MLLPTRPPQVSTGPQGETPAGWGRPAHWLVCPFSVSSRRRLLFFVAVTGGRSIAELRINGYIRAPEVRLVAPDGSQIGVKKLSEALWLADQLGLDLVEVAPDAKPPVCRLMDYGKFKYEQSIREREARKHQKRTVIKELRMAPRIEDHDFEINLRKALDFLDEGDKVKVTVRFRGGNRSDPSSGAASSTGWPQVWARTGSSNRRLSKRDV